MFITVAKIAITKCLTIARTGGKYVHNFCKIRFIDVWNWCVDSSLN